MAQTDTTSQAPYFIISRFSSYYTTPPTIQANQTVAFPNQESFDVAIGNSVDNYIQNNYHAWPTDTADTADTDTPNDPLDLCAMLTKQNDKKIPPNDIYCILSSSLSKKDDKQINVAIINGEKYICKVNAHQITYNTSTHTHSAKALLVDHGANGGIAGNDVCIIERTGDFVDIEGMMKHRENNIELVTCGGVTNTQCGKVIVIMHQYAYAGRGNTIHSSAQLEWFKHTVNDRSLHSGSKQCIQTIDGYMIPLHFQSALAYMPLRPYTNKEFKQLPHVILTSPDKWVPTCMDLDPTTEDEWFDSFETVSGFQRDSPFDEYGEYR